MSFQNKTDKELVEDTGSVAHGQGPTVEMMRRLKNSIDFSSWAMIALTIILIFFTAILIWQGLNK